MILKYAYSLDILIHQFVNIKFSYDTILQILQFSKTLRNNFVNELD